MDGLASVSAGVTNVYGDGKNSTAGSNTVVHHYSKRKKKMACKTKKKKGK